MDIAVFGGAFDPPHLGHLTIARQLLRQKLADQVWFLPVKYHPFLKDLTPEHHRLAMLELTLEPGMKINTFELEQSETTYTYNTLQQLAQLNPQYTFSFVIGSDNLQKFNQWDHYQDLVKEFPFFVYPRQGFPLQPLYENMRVISDVEEVKISSTQIRELIAAKKSVPELVHPAVAQYITQHALYS